MRLTEGHFDALTVSDWLEERERGDPEAAACVRYQRTLIELSLINRILRSGRFRERYGELRCSLLARKDTILRESLYSPKEKWSVRMLDKCPRLYRMAVRSIQR